MSEGWNSISEPRKNEALIREPVNPSKYLVSIVDGDPSAYYVADAKKNEAVARRRELLHAVSEQIENIGNALCEAFVHTYAKHGFHIRGGVRFYIVGGRLEGKSLNEDTDLDCAFTVVSEEDDVQPRHGIEDSEITHRKLAARREFAYEMLIPIARERGFLLRVVDENGSLREGSLLEPKEYGRPDAEFRSRNLPAILITTYTDDVLKNGTTQ